MTDEEKTLLAAAKAVRIDHLISGMLAWGADSADLQALRDAKIANAQAELNLEFPDWLDRFRHLYAARNQAELAFSQFCQKLTAAGLLVFGEGGLAEKHYAECQGERRED